MRNRNNNQSSIPNDAVCISHNPNNYVKGIHIFILFTFKKKKKKKKKKRSTLLSRSKRKKSPAASPIVSSRSTVSVITFPFRCTRTSCHWWSSNILPPTSVVPPRTKRVEPAIKLEISVILFVALHFFK